MAEVLSAQNRMHRLGIIPDPWPSIEQQMEYIAVSRYLSFCMYCCYAGVFKPDRRIFPDAPEKRGALAELGITSILIAANPVADAETDYLKIFDLREMIR